MLGLKVRYFGIALLLCSFVTVSFARTASADDKKPNIVMLMTDDTGWNDFRTYGGGANLESNAKGDKPFFMDVNFTKMHNPNIPAKAFIGKLRSLTNPSWIFRTSNDFPA